MDFNQFLAVATPSFLVGVLAGAAVALGCVRKHPEASIRWLNKVYAKSKALADKVEAEAKEHADKVKAEIKDHT